MVVFSFRRRFKTEMDWRQVHLIAAEAAPDQVDVYERHG